MTTLQTSYKYIRFESLVSDGKVFAWSCVNIKADEELCMVEYYKPWRQWVMADASPDAVFNEGCLRDILHFMGQLKGAE